jgi:hypothetical protein
MTLRIRSTRLLPTAVLLAAGVAAGPALLSAGPASATPAAGSDREAVNHLRAVTTQYHDADRAVADGYAATDECVEDMGYHYIRFAALQQPVDADHPAGLLYAPGDDGGVHLAGVEWIKVDADQNLATSGDRPSLFGHAFDGPMPGHFPGMPIHYDLHAYVWQPNPDGPFATWNRHIDC